MINSNANRPQDNRFVIGLDVHKNKWSVTIRALNMELKTFSMEPSPAALAKHLRKNYPKGEYYSVYEAGFCGFWIHRELCDLGICNVVVNPADVPTSDKERDKKTDPRDSRKLARELQNGSLEPLYVPGLEDEHLRTLCRARRKCRQQCCRVMQRIRSLLAFGGEDAPDETAWSGAFIQELERQHSGDRADHSVMRFFIAELKEHRQRHAQIIRELRRFFTCFQACGDDSAAHDGSRHWLCFRCDFRNGGHRREPFFKGRSLVLDDRPGPIDGLPRRSSWRQGIVAPQERLPPQALDLRGCLDSRSQGSRTFGLLCGIVDQNASLPGHRPNCQEAGQPHSLRLEESTTLSDSKRRRLLTIRKEQLKGKNCQPSTTDTIINNSSFCA